MSEATVLRTAAGFIAGARGRRLIRSLKKTVFTLEEPESCGGGIDVHKGF